MLSREDKLRIVEGWPYVQLTPPPKRLLLLNLLLHVDGARELFEEGEAGEACRLVREATHIKLGSAVGVDKETFLHQVLSGLTGDQRVNTYELDESERAERTARKLHPKETATV